MATNNKDFRIKNGLVVEGSTATVNGNAIITSASSVNDLADVTVTSPSSGQVLKWNGSAWINDTDATGAGGGGNSFTTIDVPNGTDPVADSATDTLTFVDGANITITGNSTTDTVTVAVDSDIVDVNSLTFDTTPTSPGTSAGTIFWDDGDGVPKAILNANVTVGVNQELILKVKNATGSTIEKGSVVYINGAQGQNPTVALADADTEGTSSKTFGFAAEAIIDGAEGFLITEGILRGVNTLGFTEGGAVWLSSTAGAYTQTIPAEPAHAVFLGYAVKAHASAGEIIVKIQNGYELTELHGVTIDGTPADNEVLAYDTTSGLWINQTASEAGLSVVGHTHLLADVTDVTSSAAELNILDGATLSTTELNYVDGVTSAIQTQIDGKASSSHTHGNITSDGKVGSTSGLVLGTTTAGAVAAFTASAPSSPSTEFLRGDGTWVVPTDTNTTYAVSAETVAGGANLRLTGASPSSTDDVKIASGTNVTVTRTDADTITISSTDTNTVTRLQGTGGSLVSGDITIQGAGATATSQSGNTITVATSTDNFLINGAFDIWQRGTSSTTNNVYLADRWIHSRSAGTHTVSRSGDTPVTTLPYSLLFSSTSGTNPSIEQRIESSNALLLAGQTVTFSIWAKSTVGTGGLSWSTSYPETTANDFSNLTSDQTGVFAASMTIGVWTRYSASFTVSAQAVRGYLVKVFRSVTTTSTTTLYSGAQLELGSVLTAFRRNATSIQAELAACQRYYVRLGSYGGATYMPTVGQVFNTTLAGWFLPLPVRMRIGPTADFSAASTFNGSTASGGSTSACTGIIIANSNVDMAYIQTSWSVAQSLTAGHAIVLTMSSTAFLGFNAEL